jgi:thiol-disulfide isomerase/thioredoxin
MNNLLKTLIVISYLTFSSNLYGQTVGIKQKPDSVFRVESLTVDANTVIIGSSPVSEQTTNAKFHLPNASEPIGIKQFNDSVNTSRYSYQIRHIKQESVFTLIKNKESIFNYLGKKIPVETIETSKNRSLQFKKKNSNLTYINFWASWCGPCIEEFKLIDSIKSKHPNVTFIGIGAETDSIVNQVSSKHKMPFLVAKNGTSLTKTFENRYYPMHVVVDRNNIVKVIIPGLLEEPKLKMLLNALDE